MCRWPVTVDVVEVGVVDTRYGVSQPGADADRSRCACLQCTQGLAGRGDGYQCGLDWGRSSSYKVYFADGDIRLTPLFHDNPCKPAAERLNQSGF